MKSKIALPAAILAPIVSGLLFAAGPTLAAGSKPPASHTAVSHAISRAARRLAPGRRVVKTKLVNARERPSNGTDRIEFNRDIRPILADNCLRCHGSDPGSRMAGLRLDVPEGAFLKLASGRFAVVPGHPEKSEILERVTAPDDERMPPSNSGKRLLAARVNLLRRWIQQGAPYQPHWAYIPPVKSPLPPVRNAGWIKSPIDRFVLARLEHEGIAPSPDADRGTLIRRLSLDLTGIPPRMEDVDAFVADRSPNAYEKQVDRLLASPQYGERMASAWLDIVRYADTDGYHGDQYRSVYPYRDYVIQAFNQNMPFDRFTREQIAGDLLPNATIEQKVASGYNRLNMITREGGAQPKEYLAKYAADRVRTTSEAWLGSTLGCAECHDHKYDPFTTKDFYSFEAFFGDLKQVGVYPNDGPVEPVLQLPSPDQSREMAQLDAAIARLNDATNHPSASVQTSLAAGQARWEKQILDGIERDPKHGADGVPDNVVQILKVDPARRTTAQQKTAAVYYRGIAPELQADRTELAAAQKRKKELDAQVPYSLVSESVKPAVTRILPRGNWMDDSGEIVSPAVPHFLPPLPAGMPVNRLALAKWLVSRQNPLTARVFVNRLWLLLFGLGLERTAGDLGTQAPPPTYPKLLDWLAVDFMDSSWNVKQMVKRIVMSHTYRQSSVIRPDLQEKDPYNLLLARQGRFRMDAETVRDNALAIAGTLSLKVGGRSVYPYQPDHYWDNCNTFTGPLIYHQDHGENLYRRGLYTFWKRSFLHPSLLAFDAPSREECAVERIRSNTPLQALVLLNDPTYVESARVFATAILRDGGRSPSEQLNWAFRRALARPATPQERALLLDLQRRALARALAHPAAAADLLKVGEWPTPPGTDPVELASWTEVARVILNLSETTTRE